MTIAPSHLSENLPGVSFNGEGDVLRWNIEGMELVEWPASRANAPVDFGGIQIWVTTAHCRQASSFLPWREDTIETIPLNGKNSWERRGQDWSLSLAWSLENKGRTLAVALSLCGFSPERLYQIEYLLWTPRRANDWPEIQGQTNNTPGAYHLKKYGTVSSRVFDAGTAVKAVWPDGGFTRVSSNDPMSQPHYYHRGRLLKLGSTSGVINGGPETPPLCVQFLAEMGESKTQNPLEPVVLTTPKIIPKLPHATGLKSGLMLHLQYIGGTRHLLEKWCEVASSLGYDFIVLELNRALACHPMCPEWAWSWDDLSAFVSVAAAKGLQIVPCYNLLGHQNETALLQWHPEWRESHYDCLCPSLPEVINFSSEIITRLASVCQSSIVCVGGDEVKIPEDSRPLVSCSRCGQSPNMNVIVQYWNALAQRTSESTRLMIWSDMFLPKDRFQPPLTANNTDGRASEYLEALDKHIILENWQYQIVETERSVQFLQQYGHEVVLAAGQYHLENPFRLAQTTRKLGLPFQIQTTWASPWPDDIPLESVAAGALAHGASVWGPDIEPRCIELAQCLNFVLPIRSADHSQFA